VLDSQKNSANDAVNREENVDETTKLLIDLEESDHDIIDGRPLSVVLHIDEPVKTPDVENNLKVPWTIGEETKSSAGSFKPGLFYIGNILFLLYFF
jgi:hypothetical protein